MRKNLLSILGLASMVSVASAQMPAAITMKPANATGKDQITLTFNPDKACESTKSLRGETKIQMHSSARTPSTAGAWGTYGVDYNAVPKDGHTTTDLTANGDGTFSITMIPMDYYGVPADSVIVGLSIVFNNGSWDKEGKDTGKNVTDCVDFKVPLSTTSSTSIKSISSGEFSAYPNPVTNLLTVENASTMKRIVITNVIGEQVLRVSVDKNTVKIATDKLQRGVYIISVYDENGLVGSQKLLKK